jgi:ABC-type branched-subunit amino acid transport system ATPase component
MDPSHLSELFNQIAPLNPENETRLEDLLRRSIEPRLRRLRYAKLQGTRNHLVYVDLGKAPMIPVTQMGQAFARTLQIYCEIFAKRPKMLLIDEIENGLYHEGLEDFWHGLLEVLDDQDVQLFATTHSRECMVAACEAAKQRVSDPLRYLRLDRRLDNPEKVVATTFGTDEMETAVKTNIEMR